MPSSDKRSQHVARQTPQITPPAPEASAQSSGHQAQGGVTFSHHQVFLSNLPPAHELQQMEAICPGTLQRMLDFREQELNLLESQATHRRALETKVVDANTITQHRGAWFAFILVMSCFSVVAYGYSKEMPSASWLGGIAVLSITSCFIGATWSNSQERLKRLLKNYGIELPGTKPKSD